MLVSLFQIRLVLRVDVMCTYKSTCLVYRYPPMAHVRNRRARIVEGPLSASLFFDSPKPKTLDVQNVRRMNNL